MDKKHDYNCEMEEIIASILKDCAADNKKPRLLLHACCGPCSSAILERLCGVFDITVLFYNPNIYPIDEYERRRLELYDFARKFPCAESVSIVELPYDDEEFNTAVNVRGEPSLADEEERGERCRRCYEMRLKKTYEYACSNGFDYFTTTLSISPFKDSGKINALGRNIAGAEHTAADAGAREAVCSETDAGAADVRAGLAERTEPYVRFLFADFKKKNGFKRSLELSQEYNLYRQEYCGCVYSFNAMKKRGKDNGRDSQ